MGLRAWRNRGGMVFEEITEALGLTAAGNWRSLVVDDPDEDGDADFIVGGTGYSPRVLRNDIDTGLHRFSLRLRGTASDALAMGAVVTVFGADVPPRRAVVGEHASPRATSVRTLFFGTGREPTAERVEIAWPSGYVQDVLDLPTGRLHVITEPPLLAVTPSSREVPADGVSVAEVRILPHDRAAQPMAAEVVFTLDGPGELVSVARDGLAWVATVRAPTSPGQARVRVTQDGRRWGIAPKLSWLAVQPADAP